MQAHLTYDVQISADSWTDVETRLPAQEGEILPINLRNLRDNELRGAFFVVLLISYYYGYGVKAKVRQLIRGHD